MRRRTVLASVALGGTLSGCTDLLFETECAPGEAELGSLYRAVDGGEDRERVSVRGTVLAVDERTMTIGDGTGYAVVSPAPSRVFNDDWFYEGECVEAEVTVENGRTRSVGALHLDLRAEEDINDVGDTGDPPDPPPRTDLRFETTYLDTDSDGEDDAVELTHRRGESVPAEELAVRYTPEENLEIRPWADVAGIDPSANVDPGDTARVTRSDGRVVWKPRETWGEIVSGRWQF